MDGHQVFAHGQRAGVPRGAGAGYYIGLGGVEQDDVAVDTVARAGAQEDLRGLCQLHRTHISAIERQELNVGVDTIERIARAFAVPAYVLLMPRAQAQALLYEVYLAHASQPG